MKKIRERGKLKSKKGGWGLRSSLEEITSSSRLAHTHLPLTAGPLGQRDDGLERNEMLMLMLYWELRQV